MAFFFSRKIGEHRRLNSFLDAINFALNFHQRFNRWVEIVEATINAEQQHQQKIMSKQQIERSQSNKIPMKWENTLLKNTVSCQSQYCTQNIRIVLFCYNY